MRARRSGSFGSKIVPPETFWLPRFRSLRQLPASGLFGIAGLRPPPVVHVSAFQLRVHAPLLSGPLIPVQGPLEIDSRPPALLIDGAAGHLPPDVSLPGGLFIPAQGRLVAGLRAHSPAVHLAAQELGLGVPQLRRLQKALQSRRIVSSPVGIPSGGKKLFGTAAAGAVGWSLGRFFRRRLRCGKGVSLRPEVFLWLWGTLRRLRAAPSVLGALQERELRHIFLQHGIHLSVCWHSRGTHYTQEGGKCQLFVFSVFYSLPAHWTTGSRYSRLLPSKDLEIPSSISA